MKKSKLIELAKAKAKREKKAREDRRYRNVIGRFVYAGLIQHNEIKATKAYITLGDVLFAAELEPRIYELLPAVMLKRPGMIGQKRDIPEDLLCVMAEVKRNEAKTPYKNVPADKYLFWMDKIGHKGKTPTIVKSYRFTKSDLEILKACAAKLKLDETNTIRKALKQLYLAG